jgi:release factor glutamine methyltransferase
VTSIQSLLNKAADLLQPVSESASLDAEILLCLVLAKERTYLRSWPEKVITEPQLESYWALLKERQRGKPIAYITGNREFWSRDFQVSPDVLIPRPETELLIELGLALTPANQSYKIIDLGTGSGIIAITLAVERPFAKVSASDISVAALNLAKTNAASHKVEQIQFYLSDWFKNIPAGKFDLIISNPPYLAENDDHLKQGDLRFEPETALISAKQGLSDIEKIANDARTRLEDGGFLLVEHGYNQQHEVQSLLMSLGYSKVLTHHDLSGQPRVTTGQYSPPT